jgi:predicted membrane-bound spermidine synthase
MALRLPTRLETLAFVAGFTLMTFELAAARVLAPTVGSSTYVWTSIIGVIIAALSFGFYMGGRLADARGKRRDVMWLLIIAAVLIALATLLYPHVLPWLAGTAVDVRLQAVMAAAILFAPTSFVLGMISPYLAKLNVTSLKTAGTAVANLSMWDAIGGITGTFLTGFFLFGYMGSRAIFIVLVVLLFVSTALLVEKWNRRQWITAGISLYVVALAPTYASAINIDTPSSHYTVFEWVSNNVAMRGLAMGPGGVQSGIRTDKPLEPVFWYTKELANLIEHTPQKQTMLMLGGGTYTLPQQMALKYPKSQIDVVEIDPKLIEVAREHFYYSDPANINLVFADARTYVNQTKKQYDVVVVDVYGNTDIPFTFMTREYGQALSKLVRPGGVVLVNMIAGEQGDCQVLLSALEAPYRGSFKHRLMKPNSTPFSADLPHNIIGIYSNTSRQYAGYADLNIPRIEAYTDDFTPAERLRQEC